MSGHDEAIENSLAHFLGAMLKIDPTERASAKQMLKHKWLQITKKDIEECYKAECQWYSSNGKPSVDTNANYGLSVYDLYKRNEEDESDKDDDDDEEEESVSEESVEDASYRSRSSSMDARDRFENKRAMSEPPVTWHKYLGIKWYEQFDDFVGRDDERKMDDDDDEGTETYEEENDDLYEMDPEYDPHENKLVESYDEDEDVSSLDENGNAQN